MSTLNRRVSFLWIYCFTFGTAQLLYAHSLDRKTLQEKVKNQTAVTTSLPFGTRIISSHHQLGRNKFLHETKEIATVPKDENTNGKGPLILRKSLQITDVHMVSNSSGGSANRNLNRRLKKIKSKRRRIRPFNIDGARPQLPDKKNLLNNEKNQSVSHSKHAKEFSYDAKNKSHQQKELENRTILSESNRLVVSGNIGNRNKNVLKERQRSSVRSNERGRVTVRGDLLPEIHRGRTDSIESSNLRVPVDTTTRNKNVLHQINRNRNASGEISRLSNHGESAILNKNIPEIPRNRFSLNERIRGTLPSVTMHWNKDLLSEGLGNRTESQERIRVTAPSDVVSWNKHFQTEKQENREGLSGISKVTVAMVVITRNKNYTKESNLVRPYKRTFVTVADTTVTPSRDFLQEKHHNQTELRKRNSAIVANDLINKNKKLLNVRKAYSPFNFPHSLGTIKDKSNFDVHASKGRLPCPCYWSKEKCGCNCTGPLNYDDFQTLAGSFQPCQNFSFTLSDGIYFSLPPNLFTRTSPVQNIHLKISNSTFDYLFDPTPNTSPFRGLVVEHKGLLEVLNVSVRQGWNWASLQDLRSASEGIDVVLSGCGLRRLSSDFARVASGDVGSLTVSDSGLEMVGSGAFATFGDLVKFRLPRNRLRSIRRADLPPEPLHLEEIDLSKNQLQSLDPDLFEDMPSLRALLLEGNPLRTLGQETFGAVLGRTLLQGLADFPLYCDCRLRWLKNSSLSHNSVFAENLQGATCRRPPHLRGTPFKDLSKEHLTCGRQSSSATVAN